MSNLRLAIGIMAYGGQVSAYHPMMWLELGSLLSQSHQRFSLGAFSHWDINPVDRARNFALQAAIQVQADWLLMVDADTFVQGYDDEDAGFQILRMISDADRLGAAVVAAPVMRRMTEADRRSDADNFPMVYRHGREVTVYKGAVPSDDNMIQWSTLEPFDLSNERRGLIEILSAATAIFAINIHEAKKAMAVFRFSEGTEQRPGLSEDHEFCRQIREAGGKIYADTRVKTGHISKPFPIYHQPNTNNGN